MKKFFLCLFWVGVQTAYAQPILPAAQNQAQTFTDVMLSGGPGNEGLCYVPTLACEPTNGQVIVYYDGTNYQVYVGGSNRLTISNSTGIITMNGSTINGSGEFTNGGTTLTSTVFSSGSNSINLHPSAGINLYAQTSGNITGNVGVNGGTSGTVPLTLDRNTTAVGNVDTGEDDLITFALTAGAMQDTGDGVKITAWGTTANNANAKTLRCDFGATSIITLAMTTSQVNTWRVEAMVLRTGAATQDAVGQIIQVGTTRQHDIEITTPTETLSGAITIKCTGEATSNNDIVQEGMVVEYL